MRNNDEKFTKAPNYKSTAQDIKRAEMRRKAELKKEELKFKKEFDYF